MMYFHLSDEILKNSSFRNFKKFEIYHSFKENPIFSKTGKFGWKIFQNKENIALQS